MPSSRPEAAAAITRGYEQALAALHADDLATVDRCLKDIDTLLVGLGGTPLGDDPTFEPTRAAHRTLIDELEADRERTVALLEHQRRGQRMLSAYGGRLSVVGSRVERDA